MGESDATLTGERINGSEITDPDFVAPWELNENILTQARTLLGAAAAMDAGEWGGEERTAVREMLTELAILKVELAEEREALDLAERTLNLARVLIYRKVQELHGLE